MTTETARPVAGVRYGARLGASLPIARLSPRMSHGDDVDPIGEDLVDHAVGEPPEHGEAMLVVIRGEHRRVGGDQTQHALSLRLETVRRLVATGLIPSQGGLVL